MINDALKIIERGLELYIQGILPDIQGRIVAMDNIALFQKTGGSKEIDGRVVMTLVNIEEETTLKNFAPTQFRNEKRVYEAPPVNLNLFVLFSVISEPYLVSLQILSLVIEFFQINRVISLETIPIPIPISGDRFNREIVLYPSIYSATFEEVNQLWGSLGGKQFPSVIYKIPMVTITARKREDEVPVILEINTNE
jgi:hypothetical protein